MWHGNLRDQYQSQADFNAFSKTYALAARLGFSSEKAAWSANPKIQGSTNPADYRLLSLDGWTRVEGTGDTVEWTAFGADGAVLAVIVPGESAFWVLRGPGIPERSYKSLLTAADAGNTEIFRVYWGHSALR